MAGIKHEKLTAVVERFYEAAGRPELWSHVLAEYAEAVGAAGALLIPGPTAPLKPMVTESLEETVTSGFRDGWFERNPRFLKGMKFLRGPDDVMTDQRIFAPDEIGREPFYAEFAHRFGFGWFAGMLMVDDGPASLFLSLERDRRQGLFEPGEVEHIRHFARHFQQAGRLASLLARSHADGLLGGLSMLACGGILLNAVGMAIGMNERAERHLGQGLRLSLQRLAAQDAGANTSLQDLIASLVRPGPIALARVRPPVVLPRPDRRPLVVHGAPIAGSMRDLFLRAKAILTIVDPEEHRDPAEPVLRQAFGLTAAECRIATALARGRDAAEIARAFGVREVTVRTQIKTIFTKTETRRQAELVALLHRMAVGNQTG